MPVYTPDGRSMRQLFVYILTALLLVSCEVIPYEERYQPVENGNSERCHVLLEFTGFRCVNCPAASDLAQSLQQTYEGQLYVVALHPASNPFTQGKYDYTCPAADSIYQWMGGDASTPFPAGNIDMKPYDGEWFVNTSKWATMVYEAIQETEIPDTDPVKTSYWLVEDSVPGVQAMPDGSVSTTYYHRHVLRGVWEDEAAIVVPEGCRREHLSVLKLTIDPSNNQILQAYETTLDTGAHH